MRKLGFGILMALLSLFVFNMDLEARKTWATGKHGIKVLILCTGNTCRSQMAHGLWPLMEMTWRYIRVESALRNGLIRELSW